MERRLERRLEADRVFDAIVTGPPNLHDIRQETSVPANFGPTMGDVSATFSARHDLPLS